MKADLRSMLPHAAIGLLALAFAATCVAFVWQPRLASFADDSVSYLVMARVFSPWQSVSLPVAEAFAREAFYPPLFPMLLALTGVSHDFAAAQALTALLLAASLPVLYALGVRWLGGKWTAAAAVTVTALLPSLWIHVRGVLSEPLFGLLLLATLFALEPGGGGRRKLLMLALLMSALALTRTVGLVIVGAYAIWTLTRRAEPLAARIRALVPALSAVAAYAAWVLLRPGETSDDYARILVERANALLDAADPWGALAASLSRQANSLSEAWAGAVLLFWVEGQPLRPVLAGLAGILALAGMLLRVMAGKPDAWMVAAYLATFLVWPFYDQMTRFLFPVLPVLVLYAFWALAAALRAAGRPATAAHALLALMLLSLAVPGLAFIRERAKTGGRYAEMTDWYRRADLDEARARAEVHLDLLADMDAIKAITRPGDRVMWVTPSYIALLADRRGVPAPPNHLDGEAYRQAVLESRADYVFLSEYHPRDTISGTAWSVGMAALLAERPRIVHMRMSPRSKRLTSILLKMERPGVDEARR